MTQSPNPDPISPVRSAMHTSFRAAPLLAIMLAFGCQSTNTVEQSKSDAGTIAKATKHIESPIRRLQAQAELESFSPSAAIDESIIRGFVPSELQPLVEGSQEHQRAIKPLDQVVSAIPAMDPPGAPVKPDAGRSLEATKLYVSARSNIQKGNSAEALEQLSRAASLDPTSSKIFNAIGELYLDQGDRMSAISAYRQAANLDGGTPRTLVLLASDAAAAREYATAIQLALKARSMETDDPMPHAIAGLIMGNALIDEGYLLAGAESLTEALSSFDTSSRDPNWRTEIVQFHSQRNALWMRVGDAWTMLDSPSRASAAYAAAVDPELPAPFQIVARRIASYLRSGQPSIGALAFLDHLAASPSSTAQEESNWAQALSMIPSLGSAIPDAIRELREKGSEQPSDARTLMRHELAARDNAGRAETLASASVAYISPILVAQSIENLTSDEQRFQACVEILRGNPQASQPVAEGFVRSLDNPLAFVRAHAMDSDATQQLLIGSAALELGRADLMIDSPSIDTSGRPELIAVQSQLDALNGRWADSDRGIDQLLAISTPFATRSAARSLLVAQQPTRAWETIAQNADYSDATVEDLHAAASIALLLNKDEDARSFLERAIETDPDFEEGYEQLILLHAPEGALADEDEHRRILRQLASRLPRSDLFALVRANEIARNGMLRESEQLLIQLAERSPHRDVGINLLMGIWAALDDSGDSEALDRAESWLRAHIERTPVSISGQLALARLAVQRNDPQRALHLLDAGYESTGSPTLARTAESLLDAQLDRSAESIDRVIERTENNRSIDAVLDRAGAFAEQQLNEQCRTLLSEHIPTTIELLPQQRMRIQSVLFTLAQGPDGIISSNEWIALFDRLEPQIAPIPVPLSRVRISMLAQLSPAEHDLIVNAITETLDALPADSSDEQREAVELIAVQQLLSDDRMHDAFAVLHQLATRDGVLNDRLGIEILRLNAGLGDTASATRTIERLARDGFMAQLIKIADEQLGLPSRDRPATTDNELRSDLAYIIASFAQAFGREDESIELFELTLSYDDMHPWANNDYGYMLVERDERLDEAEQMLVRAVEVLPKSSSVLDSLGWARYKFGVLENETDNAGQITREGAVSLLERAVNAESEVDSIGNATIYDHLGDSYWRLSRYNDAIKAWLDAEQVLRSQIQQATALPEINAQALERMSSQLEDLRQKLSDAESGRAPSITPIPDWTEPVPIRPRIEVDPGK